MTPPSVGIIGCGNMGAGLARGLLGAVGPERATPLFVYSRSLSKVLPLEAAGALPCAGALELAERAAIVILAVKPYQTAEVVREIAPVLAPEKILVSVAAGLTVADIRNAAGNAVPIVRVMPNTLVSVGRGQFGLCLDDPRLTPAQKERLRGLFAALGRVVELPEEKINVFSALAGCGPAYVFQIADAFIEAGVTMGIARSEAAGLVFGLFAGCAAMAEERGLHPAVLREQVTSPGGQTIAGCNHLDRTGVRGHIIDAVLAAMRRGSEMERENS